MRFLQRGKKMSKESSFDISEFVVLGYDELLQVNGAGGKSSGGSSSSSGPSGSPSGSTSSSQTSSSSGTSYVPSSAGMPSNIPSGFRGENSNKEHNSSGSSPSSTESSNLRNQGYPSSTDYNPGTYYEKDYNTSGSSLPNSNSTPNQTPTPSPIIGRPDPDYLITKREAELEAGLKKSLKDAAENGEGKYKEEGQCDGFVESQLKKNGQDPNYYLAGPASTTNVQQHIDKNLQEGNTEKIAKNNAPELDDGTYIVMMNDSTTISKETGKPYIPHCGFLRVEGGTVTFTDNGSGNYNKAGGIQQVEYKGGVQDFQDKYGYNSFYYVPVNVRL